MTYKHRVWYNIGKDMFLLSGLLTAYVKGCVVLSKKRTLRDDAKSLIRDIEAVIEITVLSLIYYFVWRNGYDVGIFPYYHYNGKYVLIGVYAIIIFILFANLDCFKFGQLKTLDVGLGQLIALFGTNLITYFQLCLIANTMVTPLPIMVLFVIQVLVAAVLLKIYAKIYYKLYSPRNMILVYGNDNAVSLKIKMDTRPDKYNVSKLISIDEGYKKITEEIQKYDAVILNDIPAQLRNDILKFCYLEDIRVYVVPKISDILVRGGRNVNLFDTPLLSVRQRGISFGERIIKRTADILFSAIALIIASPVMLGVAIAIKCEDGGPVLYKQDRLTINQKEFKICKFRSMRPDAEKFTGAILASENDPRITKVGKFIRATRLDEIPQLINILKGDMSFVGPRPERKKFVDEFCEEMPEFAYRTKVKGGLTGFAQIYGKYNTSSYDKLRLDLMYIENYSLMLDIKLMLLTIKIIFSKDSTEGIDIAEQNKALAQELIKQNEENK